MLSRPDSHCRHSFCGFLRLGNWDVQTGARASVAILQCSRPGARFRSSLFLRAGVAPDAVHASPRAQQAFRRPPPLEFPVAAVTMTTD